MSFFFNANRFHLLASLGWQFSIFLACQLIFPIFLSYVPEWKCENGVISRDCEEFLRFGGNVTFVNVFFHSAAMEYSWICGNYVNFRSLLPQIQFFGMLTGTLSLGALSDIFGRKPISILTLSLGIFSLIFSVLISSFRLLFFIRFLIGFSAGGVLVVVHTFVMELLLPQQRMSVRAFCNWGTARFVMTLVCFFARSWRLASISCGLIAFPALLLVVFIFPESPTWLHSKGRLEEMRASEKHIAKIAGIEYVPVEHRKIEYSEKSFCELVHTGGLFRRLLVLWCMWFVASICGYATDLNSSSISGNLFLNQILFSLLSASSKIVSSIFPEQHSHVPGFSRRILHQGSQSIVCLCYLLLTFMSLQEYKGSGILVVNIIGTVFIEYTWDACYLCVVESMETSYRATSTGSCSLFARIGAIVAPTLNYLSLLWPPAVYVTVASLGAANLAISFLFLKESKGVNLDEVGTSEKEEVELEEKEIMNIN